MGGPDVRVHRGKTPLARQQHRRLGDGGRPHAQHISKGVGAAACSSPAGRRRPLGRFRGLVNGLEFCAPQEIILFAWSPPFVSARSLTAIWVYSWAMVASMRLL